MKKVVLTLAVLFSVAMVACNGNKKAETVDSDTVVAAEVVEAVTDSNDTMAAAAVETVNNGDTTVAVEVAEAPAAK